MHIDTPQDSLVHTQHPGISPGHSHGICWKAVIAGAIAAAALSLILIVLGIGLGFSAVSPWADDGAGAKAVGVSAILWLTLTSLVASGTGGYLAGRLRSQWLGVHSDEVYFRNTANGFLAWAVATLLTATLLSSAIGSIVGGVGKAAGTAVSGLASTAATAGASAAGANAATQNGVGNETKGQLDYFVDSLFRSDGTAVVATDAVAGADASSPDTASRAPSATATTGASASSGREVTGIFANAIRSGVLPPEDARYIGQLVAQRSNLSQAEAEKRVTDTFNKLQTTLQEAETKAREAADTARKASSAVALWMFISLLFGALVASYAGLVGGKHRLRESNSAYL